MKDLFTTLPLTQKRWAIGAVLALVVGLVSIQLLSPSDPRQAPAPFVHPSPAPIAAPSIPPTPKPTAPEPLVIVEEPPPPPPLPVLACYRAEPSAPDAAPPLGLGVVFGKVWRRTKTGLQLAATTRVEARSAAWTSTTETDERGRYRLELPPGSYQIHAPLAGQEAASAVTANVQFQSQFLSLLVKPSGRIRGLVTFEGTLLEGAKVELAPLAEGAQALMGTTTDAEGAFEFSGVPQDLSVRVRVRAKTPREKRPIAPALSESLRLTQTQPEAELAVELKRGSSLLDFIVKDAEKQAPLGEVKVVVSGAVTRAARTTARGLYSAHGLPEGTYEVTLHKPGYVPGAGAFKVDGEAHLTGEALEMQPIEDGPLGRVLGVVRTRYYESIEAVRIDMQLTRPDKVTRVSETFKTPPFGVFSFDSLPMGRGTLRFTKPGFKGVSLEFALSKVKPVLDLEVFLQREATISGVVLVDSGSPWGTQVRVLGTKQAVRTDEDGRFRFGGLPPGSYRVEATAPGFPPVRQTVELSELPPGPNLVIPLVRGDRTVSGWVLSPRGVPLPGASVKLLQAGAGEKPPRWKTRTDSRGAFLFEDLPRATFALWVGSKAKVRKAQDVSTEVGHVWGLNLTLDSPAPNFAAVSYASVPAALAPTAPSALLAEMPTAPTHHPDCILADRARVELLQPDAITLATDVWEYLIGRDSVRAHLDVARRLLLRQTRRELGALLEPLAKAAVAGAWDPLRPTKACKLELEAAKQKLLASLSEEFAPLADALESLLDQFAERIWANAQAIRRARLRLNTDLQALKLTPREAECVTKRLWENTVARF